LKDPYTKTYCYYIFVSSTKTRTEYRTLFLIQISEHVDNIQNE